MYATSGVEQLKEHLMATGAYDEAKRNSEWTRMNLTPEQLEQIKNFPEKMVIDIGGKKVVLSHYIKDYNTGELVINPEDYDAVFQGHVHFEGKEGNVETLRGAGIGGKSGKAYYIILTENENGGYTVEERVVDFNRDSSINDVTESSMTDQEKDKIKRWLGGQ